jgi:hypothetical protein
MSDCDSLLQAANDALTAAQACDPHSDAVLCRDTVDDPCGCSVPVARAGSAETKAYLAALDKLKTCPVACAAVVCRSPRNTSCEATSRGHGPGSSSTGQCTTGSFVSLP